MLSYIANKQSWLILSISAVLLGFSSKNCLAVAAVMISLGSPTNHSKKRHCIKNFLFIVSHIVRVFSTLILHVFYI